MTAAERLTSSGLTTLVEIEAFEAAPLDWETLPPSAQASISATAARTPDTLAIVALANAAGDVARSVSYAELAGDVIRAANAFAAAGARHGAVACLLPNLIETHVTLWGATAAGIAAPINPFLEARQIGDIARSAGVRLMVLQSETSGDGVIAKLRAEAALLPSLQAVFLIGADPAERRALSAAISRPVLDFAAALAAQPGDQLVDPAPARPDDVAACYHTGGTTGSPKLARHSHRNQMFMAWALTAGMRTTPGERLFCGLPLFHVNAGIITGLNPFLHGQTVVLLTPAGFRNRKIVGNFWPLVERFRPFTFSAVPTIYGALAEVPVNGADISSLRYCISGAAPLPADVLRRFEAATGLGIAEGYGLTEGTCVSTGNPFFGERRHGSVGLRMPYTSLRIAHRDAGGGWRDGPPGTSGHVLIAGPNVFLGYLGQSSPVDAEGWLDTGDLGRIDADGYLWLTGRAKDLIIRGGHNIDPGQIEEALQSHPAVALAAAIGLPDRAVGELPIAYVSLRPGMTATADDLIAHARSRIPERAAVPVAIEILESLPVTAVGKIHKVPLRHAAVQRAFSEALQAAGIPAAVQPREVPGKGLSVRVETCDIAAARAALSGFVPAIEFIGSADATSPLVQQKVKTHAQCVQP